MMDTVTASTLAGNAETELTPQDAGSTLVKVYDISGAQTALLALFITFAGSMNISLPPVLTALSVAYEKGGGAASYSEENDNLAAGSASISGSASANAQADAFSIPKVSPTIVPTFADNLPVVHYVFYLASPTQANILARLLAGGVTASAWPIFKPLPIILTLFGSKVNSSAKANASASLSVSDAGASTSTTQGAGDGYDTTPQIDYLQIPPTLHGSFSLTASSSQGNGAVATALVIGTVSAAGGPITATATATGSVSPSSISATSPAALPTSGKYLYTVSVDPGGELGLYMVNAVVFDFATIA